MDKNTLIGILLMGAVIFGFMYLNQPSQEQLEAQRQEQAQREADAEARREAEASEAIRVQEVTDADVQTLRAALRLYGRQAEQGYTFTSEAVDLTLENDSVITGTILAGGQAIDVDNVIRGEYADDVTPANAAAASRALHSAIVTLSGYRNFASHLSGREEIVELNNEVMHLEFSSKGGQISAVELTKYESYVNGDTTQVRLWTPSTNSYSFMLRSDSQKFDTADFYFTPTLESDSTVMMKLDLGGDAWWGIRYTLPSPTDYVVRMEVLQHGMADADIIPMGVSTMEFNWHQQMARNEQGRTFEERNSAIYYKEAGSSVNDMDFNGDRNKTVNDPLKWIAFKNQFFSSVIIADGSFNGGTKLKSIDLKSDVDFLKDMTATAQVNYSVARDSVAAFNFYLGPNLYPVLRDMDQYSPAEDLNLTRLIPLGWPIFRWINTLIIIPVFTFLSKYILNYGIIILVLTILIKIVLYPLTYKSLISQARMRLLAPEVKQINDKYPGNENAAIRQQKTMALYSSAGANPMSGCLPMLLQMPILIAMFSFFPSCIELRGQSFLWAHDLSAPDAIIHWNTNLWLIGDHISLFCLLMTAVNIVNTMITMQSQPGGNSMPGMKLMSYGMPLIFFFWFNDYAAGLSYYYFLSLLITIVMTYVVRHWVVDEDKMRAEMLANAKKPRKKSGFMARLEEAQRQQQAMLREQQKRKGKK